MRAPGTLALLTSLLLVSSAAAAWELDGLRLRGRLQMRWEAREDADRWTNFFRLRRARLDGRWQVSERARVVLELDAADTLRIGPGVDVANTGQRPGGV